MALLKRLRKWDITSIPRVISSCQNWAQRYPLTRFLNKYGIMFQRFEILKESAALTFITIMGFLPFTMFLLMMIPELPFLQAQTQIRNLILENFVPSSATAISGYIDQLLLQKHAWNWLNFIFLMVFAYSLFRSISRAFDRIMHVREARSNSIVYNLVQFLGTVVLGAVVLLILFSASSVPIVTSVFDLGALQSAFNWILPFVFTFAFMLLLFYSVPSSKTRTNSLLLGTLFSTLAWMALKAGYGLYIDYFTNYRGLYGVVSSIPVFIFWLYLNWIIILGGAVMITILEGRAQVPVDETAVTVQITIEKRHVVKSTRLTQKNARDIIRDILEEPPHGDQ